MPSLRIQLGTVRQMDKPNGCAGRISSLNSQVSGPKDSGHTVLSSLWAKSYMVAPEQGPLLHEIA